MPQFLLHHHHAARECEAAFAAWSGFESPLRRAIAMSSCLTGGHHLWFRVDALDQRSALVLLPPYVARRAEAIAVREIQIP